MRELTSGVREARRGRAPAAARSQPIRPRASLPAALGVTLAMLAAGPAGAAETGQLAHRLTEPWPAASGGAAVAGEAVRFPSSSPYTPADLGRGPEDDPPTEAQGALFLPPGPHAAHSLPAVVLLHGAGGIIANRELAYGAQLAAMGIAALAVDSFGARGGAGMGFTERLMAITETMLVADAYAGLRYLAERPEIDGKRVVLTGFSYGAMATTYALYAQLADRLAAAGLRFAGHVAFYGPCIARFDDSRTTGAPLLMLQGAEDVLTDPARCEATAAALRRGGSAVEILRYPGAVHQWDGFFARRLIGHDLSACDFAVERSGVVRDRRTGLAMSGPFFRKLILALCVGGPYPIGRDDAVRAESTRDWGRFLAKVFGGELRRASSE